MGANRGQLRRLLRRGRHDQFAAIPVRDAVSVAIAVERMLAGNARPRHPAAGGIVDPGMDHFAVARGCYRADALGLVQNHHFTAGPRQPPCHRKADHPGPDNDALEPVHVRLNPEEKLRPRRAYQQQFFSALLSL